MGTPRRAENHASILIGLFVLVIIVVILRNAWVCDDAYISFRTVDNFVNGYGLTWNTDERVQAFTNPLWVFLMSGFYIITGELYFTSIIVSIVVTLSAILIVSLKISRSLSGALLVLAAALFSKAFIDYATSGLENPLSYLILAGFLCVYFGAKEDERVFFPLCVLAGLAALNRMDTLLLYLPVLVGMFVRLRSFRALLTAVAGFAPFILWELFSMVYYGFPFPNTYYAKLHSGIPVAERLYQGLIYYLETLNLDPLTLIVIIAGILLVILTRDRRSLPVSVGIGLYLLYIVSIGGDFMSGRFFAVPFVASLALISRYPIPETLAGRLIPVVVVAVLGLASPRPPLLSDKTYGTHGEAGINEKGIADERGWYYQSTGLLRTQRTKEMPAHKWADDGKRLRLKGDDFSATGCVGFAGFYAGPDIHVYDGYGLTEPLLARLPTNKLRDWRVGHFSRIAPFKYVQGLKVGENMIADTNVAAYYDKLLLITRGDLLDTQRWVAIWRMNTGAYDCLLSGYTDPSTLTVSYAEISVPKEEGTVWNEEGNYVLRSGGLHILLDSVFTNNRFEISVDHNDYYTVAFFRDSTELGFHSIRRQDNELGGLRVDSLEVPEDACKVGYNRIIVKPDSGDDLYSVGHLRLLDVSP